MKTLNNEANKARFFALYWGQEVLSDIANNNERVLYPIVKSNMYRILESDLSLRSISSLTDEECIKLAALVLENPFNRYRNIQVTRDFKITGFPYIAVHHKNVRQRFNIDCTHVNFSVYDMEEDVSSQIDMKPWACIDYLRSIGILIPWMDLSVEYIKAYGWAKEVGA
jgi:hypothetical protein